jgi:energy-converting hydrogenase A subunit M
MLKYISDDKNFESYMKCINGNRLYTKNIVISLAKELIGKRQVTLRRFTSILILND